MSRKSRVYVTQVPPPRRDGPTVRPTFDLSPAERFGELVYLSTKEDVENGTESELMWKMRNGLENFDPDLDYILPIGHTICMALGPVLALERSEGRVKIMQWDRKLKAYEVFIMDLDAQPPQKGRQSA
jgi:hypothetical protein